LPLTTDDIERLYRDHARELLIYCARRTYDADAALDVVAEVFAAAFAQRRRCRGESPAEREAWLYGIARNLIAGFWRRGAAEQRAVRRLGIEVRDLSAEERDRVEELADLREHRRRVAADMDRLGADQREAVRLRVVEELDYAEVAARLGVSEQVARARVSRALRRMAADAPEECRA
jgi:RNA polymerase sigma-70 factor (ECF subfamily)